MTAIKALLGVDCNETTKYYEIFTFNFIGNGISKALFKNICPNIHIANCVVARVKRTLLMKLKFSALITVVFVGLSLLTPAHAFSSSSRCVASTSGYGDSQTNDCQLPYTDGEEIISPIFTCRHPSNAAGKKDLTDSGKDYLLDARILSLDSSGNVTAPQSLLVSATMANECQKRGDAYRLSGSVLSPEGVKYPISFGIGTFLPGSKDTTPTDYCFLELKPLCGFSDYKGKVTIPATAKAGMYAISLSVIASSGSAPGVKPVTENFSSILRISREITKPTAAPIATPTPVAETVSSVEETDAILTRASNHPTATFYLSGPNLQSLPVVQSRLSYYAALIPKNAFVACIGYIYPVLTSSAEKSKQVALDQAGAACSQLKKENPTIITKTFARMQYLSHKPAREFVSWSPRSYRLDVGIISPTK
jgi:hypothetical protein